MVFRDSGVDAFRAALNRTIRHKAALQRWYLSVIDTLAKSGLVETSSITGLWWAEVDTLDDLMQARSAFVQRQVKVDRAVAFSALEQT